MVVVALTPGCDGLDQGLGEGEQGLTSATLPGGTTISASLASPASGATLSPGLIIVSGGASVGAAVPMPSTALVYVLDVSGSSSFGNGCGGDQNGDGVADTVLDCEIAAATALNTRAVSLGTVAEVGVVVFASLGAFGDMNGVETGFQRRVPPGIDGDGDGVRDVVEVLRSAYDGGGLTLFSPTIDVKAATSYGSGVAAALEALAGSTRPRKLVVFLSDGANNTAPSVASALGNPPAPGVVFHAFAVGSAASCTTAAGTLGNLAGLAQATGGSCTNVSSVASLPDVLPGVLGPHLTSVEILVDGVSYGKVGAVSPALPQSGPVSVTWSAKISITTLGTHTICARAHGSDAGGTGSVGECVTITIA